MTLHMGNSHVINNHMTINDYTLPCAIILLPGTNVPSTTAVCVPLFPVTVKQYCTVDDSCNGRPILTTSEALWLV